MWWLGLLVLIALTASSSLETTPQALAAAVDTVVIAQGVDPTTLDPMNHQEAPVTVLANNLFDGLIERDPDLNLVPLLAESYQSVSPTTWEFYNADLDGMNDEAKQSMDPKRRLELFHRINRIVIDDAAAMPLYQQIDLYGASRRLVWKARGDERIKGYDMAIR